MSCFTCCSFTALGSWYLSLAARTRPVRILLSPIFLLKLTNALEESDSHEHVTTKSEHKNFNNLFRKYFDSSSLCVLYAQHQCGWHMSVSAGSLSHRWSICIEDFRYTELCWDERWITTNACYRKIGSSSCNEENQINQDELAISRTICKFFESSPFFPNPFLNMFSVFRFGGSHIQG